MTATTTIRHLTPLAPDLFELEVDRDPDFTFTPGDCVSLFAGDDDSRPYSIASGVKEPVLRFLIRRLPGGGVSDRLTRAQPGTRIAMSPPFGWFRPAGAGQAPRLFIATGTGIAPFLSAIRSGTPTPVLCLHGVRHLADANAGEDLAALTPLRLAVSREPVAPPHHQGRVTDLLDTLPVTPAMHYYLCGLDTMIVETATSLARRGVPREHIHREIFFCATR